MAGKQGFESRFHDPETVALSNIAKDPLLQALLPICHGTYVCKIERENN